MPMLGRDPVEGFQQFRCLIGSIPVHDALVAGALLFLVDCVRDLGGLFRQLDPDGDCFRVVPVVAGVADILDNGPDNSLDLVIVEDGCRVDFPGDCDPVRGCEGFHRGPFVRITC